MKSDSRVEAWLPSPELKMAQPFPRGVAGLRVEIAVDGPVELNEKEHGSPFAVGPSNFTP